MTTSANNTYLGQMLFREAFYASDEAMIQLLLDKALDINAPIYNKEELLLDQAKLNFAESLIYSEQNLTRLSSKPQLVLDQLHVLKRLGAKVNIRPELIRLYKDNHHLIPLEQLFSHKVLNEVELLACKQESLLSFLIERGDDKDLACLIQFGYPVDKLTCIVDEIELPILFALVGQNLLRSVKAYVDAGGETLLFDSTGATPFYYAACQHSLELLELLYSKEAAESNIDNDMLPQNAYDVCLQSGFKKGVDFLESKDYDYSREKCLFHERLVEAAWQTGAPRSRRKSEGPLALKFTSPAISQGFISNKPLEDTTVNHLSSYIESSETSELFLKACKKSLEILINDDKHAGLSPQDLEEAYLKGESLVVPCLWFDSHGDQATPLNHQAFAILTHLDEKRLLIKCDRHEELSQEHEFELKEFFTIYEIQNLSKNAIATALTFFLDITEESKDFFELGAVDFLKLKALYTHKKSAETIELFAPFNANLSALESINLLNFYSLSSDIDKSDFPKALKSLESEHDKRYHDFRVFNRLRILDEYLKLARVEQLNSSLIILLHIKASLHSKDELEAVEKILNDNSIDISALKLELEHIPLLLSEAAAKDKASLIEQLNEKGFDCLNFLNTLGNLKYSTNFLELVKTLVKKSDNISDKDTLTLLAYTCCHEFLTKRSTLLEICLSKNLGKALKELSLPNGESLLSHAKKAHNQDAIELLSKI
ncbi:MAG: hypothetical protein GWP59_00765 [Chlamydiales bacterium]|nr:hypothetical protein [Chlamydiales bacterium]NCF70209.1 hypothetical protein [Chlamydiales bacterium]